MIENFLKFNVFGMVRVDRQHIYVLATGILPGGRSVERTLSEDLAEPMEEIKDGEEVAILFAGSLEPNGKARIATQNLNARVGGPNVSRSPAVAAAVQKVIKQFG